MTSSNTIKLLETQAEFRRHELLRDLAESMGQHLADVHGMDEKLAGDLGNAAADFLCEHWKGQNVYIPADQQFKVSQRDLQIYQRMQRGNAPDLAREFGISRIYVYQVYRRVLAANRAKLQPGLFAEPEPAKAD